MSEFLLLFAALFGPTLVVVGLVSTVAIVHARRTRRPFSVEALAGTAFLLQILVLFPAVWVAPKLHRIARPTDDWYDIFAGSVGCVTVIMAPLTVIAVGCVGVWLGRDHRRRNAGLCIDCGYDLKSSATGACPECGRVAEKSSKEKAGAPSRTHQE